MYALRGIVCIKSRVTLIPASVPAKLLAPEGLAGETEKRDHRSGSKILNGKIQKPILVNLLLHAGSDSLYFIAIENEC